MPEQNEQVKMVWWAIPLARWRAISDVARRSGISGAYVAYRRASRSKRSGIYRGDRAIRPPGYIRWGAQHGGDCWFLALAHFQWAICYTVFSPDARGSGSSADKSGDVSRAKARITLPTVIGEVSVHVCNSGAAEFRWGAKGRSVQVGAGIASILGRALGLRPEKVKALIPVGAAAAIAAAFNTPLAGGIVHAGRSGGRSSRAGAWFGGACFSDQLGCVAIAAWQ